MDDNGLEALCGDSIIPPEMDNYMEDVEERDDIASFRYSALDIRDHLGKEDFKEIYMVQIVAVKEESFDNQRKFLIEIQDKISEIYDWEFSDEWKLVDTQYQQEQMYKFIEFLEFNNYRFLSYVWKFLFEDITQLAKIDINKYCKSNVTKIIRETEEQIETHPDNELITFFLRTYYKEKYIEWFIIMSKRYKFEIISESYE